MKEKIDALYTLVENACSGCSYEYMCGDCIIEGCSINEAYWTIRDFIEEMSYVKD